MKRVVCLMLAVMFLLPSMSIAEAVESITILLLGTDNFGYASVTNSEEMSRADAIFLLNIQSKTNEIKLLSIERDYLVILPEDLGENKLATATYFGGPPMAIKAINQLLDLNINLYAHIDIDNLVIAIDELGGVDIDVSPEEISGINTFINAFLSVEVPPLEVGGNHLTGMQAWAFVGERNNEIDPILSNVERVDRQKRLFSSALNKALSMDFPSMMKMVSKLLPLIQTNISMNDLLKIIEITINLTSHEIELQRSPQGSFSLKKVNMHRVIVPDDMSSEINFVHLFLSR